MARKNPEEVQNEARVETSVEEKENCELEVRLKKAVLLITMTNFKILSQNCALYKISWIFRLFKYVIHWIRKILRRIAFKLYIKIAK